MEELAENPGLCCAVVFINPAEDAEEFLSARRVNYVIVNQTQKPGMEFNCVNTTHMTGVFEAVSYLVKELGHKRVAIITAENSSHAERLAAFQIGLRTFSLPLPDEYLARAAGGTVEAGAEAMRKLLALKEPPTAVFADTDIKAAGVMIAVKEAGLKVPDDISVIGFDDIPEAKTLSPPLTTVKGMYFEMGAAAARMIEERREQSMKDIPSVTVNTKLAVRKSCRKAPATSAF
jgi:DNA-binding LacI/PurR family transcriptional regulator